MCSHQCVYFGVYTRKCKDEEHDRSRGNCAEQAAATAEEPAAGGVLAMLRNRRVEPLAVLSLGAIAIGLAVGLLFHDGRILLVKESFTSGALGLVCLGSLFTRKPAIFVLRRRLFVPDDSESQAEYDDTWQSRAVQAEARRTTAIWGIALLAEAAVRVGLSYLLPVGTMVTISPLLAPVILGPLAVWNLRPRLVKSATSVANQE